MAPQTMWSFIKALVRQDEIVNRATSLYIKDTFINKSVCPAAHVKVHLEQFGLTSKDPEPLRNFAHVFSFAYPGGVQKIAMEPYNLIKINLLSFIFWNYIIYLYILIFP